MIVESVETKPFGPDLISETAGLLARRHADWRAAQPLLSARFEDAGVAASALVDLAASDSSGVVALRGGRPAGYLLGALLKSEPRKRSTWVGLAGHALAPNVDPELYRDMYAVAARKWVGSGCFEHYVVLPAGDGDVLAAWHDLDFGHEQVHALRSLEELRPREVAGVEIRRASVEDLEAAAPLVEIIGRHQARPPVFGAFLPETGPAFLEGLEELLEDDRCGYWIALRGGRALGYAALVPAEPDFHVGDRCIELLVAATDPAERQRGIGGAVVERALAWARDEGYALCSTDWRATNLAASRVWPKLGFAPVAIRLHRTIDDRILWAR